MTVDSTIRDVRADTSKLGNNRDQALGGAGIRLHLKHTMWLIYVNQHTILMGMTRYTLICVDLILES